MNNIELEVSELLRKNNINYSPRFIAARDDSEWPHDLWLREFNGELSEYKTGIGHRVKLDKYGRLTQTAKKQVNEIKTILDTSDRVTFANGAIYPTPASVLHCLLLDASALDESFDNWCSDYGYDSDSMSAFRTYQSCCDIAKKLYKVIPRIIRELLQDY
jgi:hypothetical protein